MKAMQVMMRLYKAWMRLAELLAMVNTYILLSLMYWLVLTPLGTIMRLCGRDVLRRRSRTRETYWVHRTTSRQDRERFERAF